MRNLVLVVDDNRDAADMLAELIGRLGHEAYPVYDGHEAIRQAALLSPDLVLLDIGMPGIDGYDVAASIRRLPTGRHIAIVAVTGYAGQKALQHAYRSGFDHFLIKPLSLDDLRELLAIIEPIPVATSSGRNCAAVRANE